MFIVLVAMNIFSSPAASRPWRDSLNVDGPYILYTEAGVRTITVDKSGNIADRTSPLRPETFQVTDHRGKLPFEVRLREIRRQPWRFDTQPDKLFIMSDPHGRLDCVVSLLQGNGVIDKDLKWVYGRNHLAVIGDIFDRGEDVVQIFWLFYELQREAEEAGGCVSLFLGNHEPMVFSNDLRYTKPKYTILARELGMEYRALFG
ncbi:MAG: metallophosphatase, partial [Bacteroidales bacterium]|nr:metallophosphatase [Bacteroidales bacterium]